MQPIVRVLTSRWVLTGLGLAAAGAMIWLYGPFLSVLEGSMPRVAAMALMCFVWAGGNAAIDAMRHRSDARLSAGVVQGSAGPRPGADAGAEDVAEQRERLGRALRLLRQARGTRGYLYEQPWYVIIGPPGAGKTTALANAGLRFPLAAELGGDEVKGVGGTRFCDWSFTDEAVLIDTAGRYTTQDSDAATDRAGWEGFLGLLRRTRPRQPLNGVIVAIAAGDLAQVPEAERRAHARAIRSRIKELYDRLGARIPVYVVFTKLDLIRGFTDFFDDLDRERRAQVWGVTFPVVTDHAGPAGSFPREFEALTAQLSVRVIDRLQAERSPERRAAIADFPVQFASLEAPLAEFIDAAFAGTRLDPAPFLRGIYFASATQEGSPIDRLAGTLARSFGIDQRRAEALRPSQGRGHFLETLFKQVVFGESMLVVRNPRAARRRMVLRAIAWTLFALAIVGGGAGLYLAASNADRGAQRFDAALTVYRRAVEAARLDPVPVAASDLPRVKPLLDQARALPFGPADPASANGEGGGDLGLSPREKLRTVADLAYRRALERILLPRLISTLEARMRASGSNLDELYRATRVYMILGGLRPMDRALVRDWVQSAWAETYAGASLAPFRADLLTHLDALLDRPIGEFVRADADLLAQSQAQIAHVGVAARAYALLRSSAAAQAVPPFVPADAIGGLAGQRLVRPSGAKLTDPIPGVFTVAGLQTAILPDLPRTTEQAMRESWVLGQGAQFDPADVVARQRVEHEVLAMYARDYQAAWDALLADLDVVPPADPTAAVADFSVFTSPQGPIKLLLLAVVRQFTLSQPPAPAAGDPAAKPIPVSDPAIQAVDAHYRDLREFVEKGQLDLVLGTLDRLQQQIAAQVAASAGGGQALTPGMDAAQVLQKIADGAPQPVARWLKTLAQRGGAVRDDASRQQAAAAFSGAGGPAPLCQQVVQRFPFRPGARDDLALASFAELFAPNGQLDTFFTQFVRPFVDTSQRTWKLRDPASTQAPVTAEGIAAFQHAQAIRDTFFGFGGTQPQLRFALRPLSLDPGARQVTLDFGGISISWTPAGPLGATLLDWPFPTRVNGVHVLFDPPGDGPELQQGGPWALFRLLRQAGLDRGTVTLQQGERQARFELSAASAHSPFEPDLLAGFRCPRLRP